MREFSTPMSGSLSAGIPATGNLTDDVVRNAAEAPDADRVRAAPAGLGGVDGRHRAEFLGQVRGVAKGLVAAGVGPATGSP